MRVSPSSIYKLHKACPCNGLVGRDSDPRLLIVNGHESIALRGRKANVMVTENSLSSVERRGLLCHRAVCDRCEGYSLVELTVVIAITAIVTAIVVMQFTNTREMYNADDAANKVMNYLREANSRAVSNHHSYRVTINQNTNTISLIDEKTSAGGGNNDGESISGDDVLVKSEPVGVRVSLNQPSVPNLVNPPAAPFNYAPATFASNVWTAHFQSDSSVTDVNLAPVSCTIFFQPVDKTNLAGLIRAVTVFGPSGSVRFWAYDGTQLVQG